MDSNSVQKELKELPEFWCIKGCKELGDYITEYEKINGVNIGVFGSLTDYYYFLDNRNKLSSWNGSKILIGGFTEISFEDFKRLVLKQETEMITKEEFNNNTQIKIDRKLVNTYFEAATDTQKEFIVSNFKIDGSTTVGSIKGLYDLACEGWKPKIKANHPDCFKGDKVWKREVLNDNEAKFYFITDTTKGEFTVMDSINEKTNINYVFSSKEEANNNVLLYNTMMLMRNWAKFYNEVDNFKANWSSSNSDKSGIELNNNKIDCFTRANTNAFIFQISVATLERAKEMLAEFKDDLNRLIELGMFN